MLNIKTVGLIKFNTRHKFVLLAAAKNFSNYCIKAKNQSQISKRMLWALFYLVGTLSLIILLITVYLSRNNNYWKKTGIYNIGSDQVDGLMKRILVKEPFHDIDRKIYNILKEKNWPYAGMVELTNPTFFCRDLDIIKRIFVKDFEYFVNRRGFEVEKTDPHFYKMLFNQENNEWRSLRTTMSPTFTTGKIRRMFENYNISGERLVNFLKDEIKHSKDIQIREAVSRFTMDVIASSAFGVDSKMFEEPNSIFAQMAKRVQVQFDGAFAMLKIFILFISPKLMEILGFSLFDKESDNFFTNVILSSIRHREKTGEKRDDFLQLMLEARAGQLKTDEKELDNFEKEAVLENQSGIKSANVVLDDDMIVSQSIIFLLAGFDTTETLLTFASYALATNPDVQEKLANEVEKAFTKENGKLTYESINHMEYLEMFTTETLRFYPPAVRLERRATRDYKLPDSDLIVPKGTLVSIPVHAIHHDEEHYPEPEKFNPERFSPENKAGRHPYAYMPFGHGPRNCIGMRFALTEAKVAIAHLVHNFILEPCGKTHIPMKYQNSGNMKPMGGMWLKVKSRN